MTFNSDKIQWPLPSKERPCSQVICKANRIETYNLRVVPKKHVLKRWKMKWERAKSTRVDLTPYLFFQVKESDDGLMEGHK